MSFSSTQNDKSTISTIPKSLKAVSQTEAELQRFACRKMTPRRFTGWRQLHNTVKSCTGELNTIHFKKTLNKINQLTPRQLKWNFPTLVMPTQCKHYNTGISSFQIQGTSIGIQTFRDGRYNICVLEDDKIWFKIFQVKIWLRKKQTYVKISDFQLYTFQQY